MSDNIEADAKPKKERTEKQRLAFEACRAKRMEKLKTTKQDNQGNNEVEEVVIKSRPDPQKQKSKVVRFKIEKEQESESEGEDIQERVKPIKTNPVKVPKVLSVSEKSGYANYILFH